MTRAGKIALGIILSLAGLFLFSVFILFAGLFSAPADESLSTSGEKVAVIILDEPILSSEPTVRQFKKYRENRSVKAIIFRIDSPGGGVAASQEIYEEVRKAVNAGKPVIVSMGAIATSGGYYVACPATKIFANQGTLTGSIGVIMQFLNFKELMDKVGINESTYKSGILKDAGSPYRAPTAEERKYFQFLLSDVHGQFIDAVSTARKIPRTKIEKLADGSVFSGRTAYRHGLIDTLGTFEDAIDYAAKEGGIKGTPKVVREMRRRSFIQDLFNIETNLFEQRAFSYFTQPILQYRLTHN